MTNKYIGPGDAITTAAPAGGVTQGDIVPFVDCAGVALETAASGVSVSVAMEGIFTVTKKAGATLDFAVGEYAQTLTTGGSEVAVATGGSESLGIAVEAAATGDTTVKVKLATF